jgi:hypothetical protein
MNTDELIDQVFHRARQNVAEIFDEYHAEEKRRLAVYERLKLERRQREEDASK